MSFLVSKEFIKVEMEYVDLGDGFVLVINNDTERDFIKSKNLKIEKVKAGFSRPTWGSYCLYMKDVITRDPVSGELLMDNATFRKNKFRILLEELFEIKMVDGELKPVSVPLTPDFYGRCSTDFASGLIGKFDEVYETERTSILKKHGLMDSDGNPVEFFDLVPGAQSEKEPEPNPSLPEPSSEK